MELLKLVSLLITIFNGSANAIERIIKISNRIKSKKDSSAASKHSDESVKMT